MRMTGLAVATAAHALLSAPALQAQVQAEAIWQQWKDFAAAGGQSVTAASERRQGDTLVISGLAVSSTEEGVTARATLDEMRLREPGDGTVEITMSPATAMTIDTTSDGGAPVSVALAMNQSGLKVIASGTPAATTYRLAASSVEIVTTGVTEGGAALPVEVRLAVAAPAGTYAVTQGEGGRFTLASEIAAGEAVLDVRARDEKAPSDLVLHAGVAQLAAVSGGDFLPAAAMEDLGAALKAGFASNLAMTFGPLDYRIDATDASGPTAIRGKSQGGTFGVAMDRSRMAFAGGGTGVEMTVTSARMPLPEVALRYAEGAFEMVMPVLAGPDPQKFALTTRLVGLAVSDEVWNLVDPGATLPRDPATLILESSGTVRLTADLTDEAAMAAPVPPGELLSLDLAALQLTLAGAELKGSGALTFDNSDTTTFNGLPLPTGTVNLTLDGANALIDKLIAIGLLPEEQAMGARMMLGMFARPGAGPDSLVSTLEFKDKGFFANGMQLQ